jgi:hypothetical protein
MGSKEGTKANAWKGGSKSNDSNHAIEAWEKHWGKRLPKGYVVHHKDGNPENNAISNLIAITKAKSNVIHKKGKTLAEQKRATKNKPNIGTEDGLQRKYR